MGRGETRLCTCVCAHGEPQTLEDPLRVERRCADSLPAILELQRGKLRHGVGGGGVGETLQVKTQKARLRASTPSHTLEAPAGPFAGASLCSSAALGDLDPGTGMTCRRPRVQARSPCGRPQPSKDL